MSSFCGSDNDENDYEIGYREGAAVAFGLMGMAEAIRRKGHLRACPMCGRAGDARVYQQAPHPTPMSWVCMPCYDAWLPSQSDGTKEP